MENRRRNVRGPWGESSATGGEPARKWGLPSHNCKELISDSTRMSLEASSPSEHPGRDRTPLSPWFWPCERRAEKRVKPIYSDFWSTELWCNKWALFQVAKSVVIYYGSNKLICSQIRQCKVKQGGTQAEGRIQTSHSNRS